MVITSSIGHEVHRRGKLTKQIKHPVVVRESTPSYFPDTHRARMTEDEPPGLDYICFESTVTNPDGTEKIVDFSVEYMPSRGYAEISEFMASHLNSLENFFCDIISEVKGLNFKKI